MLQPGDRHIFGAADPGQARSGPPGELFTLVLHNLKPRSITEQTQCVYNDRYWLFQEVTSFQMDERWTRQRSRSLSAPSINYMLKKLKVNKQTDRKNNWPLKKSIRTGGHWAIHLLVQHNYLFFFHSFTSLFTGDDGAPANQRKALFVIAQIKHGLLRGKRLSDDNATNQTCAKNKLPWSQTREFYQAPAYIWTFSIWLLDQVINKIKK